MKRCPTCNRTFDERNLSFCVDDGTPLIPIETDDEATAVSPRRESGAGSSDPAGRNWNAPAYQPPRSSYTPSQANRKSSAWPWVLAILGIVLMAIVGLGAATAILVPRFLRASTNKNRPRESVTTSNRNDSNSNSNAAPSLNSNENENANAASKAHENTNAEESLNPPPTDTATVLTDLRNLEDEWTVANINADKKVLERILADDYVGVTEGRPQGKKQYLNDIQRDTSIEKWDFEDLKVDLKGDRAILTGIVKFTVGGNEFQYRFTDKFVWRSGRWQATASQVDPIK